MGGRGSIIKGDDDTNGQSPQDPKYPKHPPRAMDFAGPFNWCNGAVKIHNAFGVLRTAPHIVEFFLVTLLESEDEDALRMMGLT